MLYTWKCTKCDLRVDVERKLADYNKPPQTACCEGAEFTRVLYAPRVPFQHLRNAGVFADDNGNFAPRKL